MLGKVEKGALYTGILQMKQYDEYIQNIIRLELVRINIALDITIIAWKIMAF